MNMIKGWVSRKALEKCDFLFEDESLPNGAVVLIEGEHVEVQYDGNPRDSESYDDEKLARKLIFIMENEEEESFIIERQVS